MIKRHTIQCSLVYEAVNRLKRHATADEIYEAIARDHPTISRGTVYRNLNQLAESGKIRKVEVPDGADRFECGSGEHYHARCSKCGRIFDVDMAYIPDLEKSIRDPHGFAFSGHDILFKGLCSDCNTRQTGPDEAVPQPGAHAGA